MKILKVLITLLVSALALPACASYSQQPSGYFDDDAQLALIEAANRGDRKAMQRALDQGADPNAMGEDGMTPLFWSVTMQPNIEAVRYMLAHGGDPNLVTVDEEAPGNSKAILLYQAYKNANPEFIEAVLEAGADPDTLIDGHHTLLFEPLTDKRIEHIQALIEHGAAANFLGKFNYSPIFNAVLGNEYKTALVLLESGADPELEDQNERSAMSVIKNNHDRKSGSSQAYDDFIEALKEKGYLDESF